MNAVTYPEPAADAPAPSHVASLPQPARSKQGLYAAFGVVAMLIGAIATYALWPRPAAPPRAQLWLTGTAEQVVTAFLHGDRPTLERLVAAEVPESLQAGNSYVRSAWAVSSLETEHGWQVVVAADHFTAVPGGFGDPRIEHFQVAFQDRPTGPVALGLPSMVPAPEAPTLRAAPWPIPPADEMTVAIERYLSWLLAGGPGTPSDTPVTPPPFTEIVVVGMQRTEVDGGFDVLVAVEGTRSDGTTLPLHYPLRLVSGEGGWVVSRPGS